MAWAWWHSNSQVRKQVGRRPTLTYNPYSVTSKYTRVWHQHKVAICLCPLKETQTNTTLQNEWLLLLVSWSLWVSESPINCECPRRDNPLSSTETTSHTKVNHTLFTLITNLFVKALEETNGSIHEGKCWKWKQGDLWIRSGYFL